jgi:maleylacetoacetate isomerase
MQLYSYFRSTASFRVRIALELKGLSAELIPIHLVKGEHAREPYTSVNPQGRVPALRIDSGELLIQSLAIIEYLDEVHPQPPFLPQDSAGRAQVRAVAHIVACDIHPLGNLGPRNYFAKRLGLGPDAIDAWTGHWIEDGFAAIEALIEPGPFCFGPQPTLADICLIPQVFNARRFKADMSRFPKIAAVEAAAAEHPAFQAAAPARQPDAE